MRALLSVALLSGMTFLVTGCTKKDSSDPAAGPRLVSKLPEAGATDVIRNTDIRATFDREMDGASLTGGAFYADADAGALAATANYDVASRTVTLVPAVELPASAEITVHVTTAAQDLTGQPVGSEITWSFTTGTMSDTTPPTFAGITSASGGGDGTSTLAWSAASDDFTEPGAIVYRAYLSTDLSTVTASVTGATSLVTPALAPGTYEFTVRAADQAGNQDSNVATASATISVPVSHFSTDVLPLLNPTCTTAACHDSTAPQQGLNLTSSAAYGNIVNVSSTEVPSLLLIKPGDAANSYLYRKLTGTGITGNQMPSGGGSPFTSDELAAVRNWILAGAPND